MLQPTLMAQGTLRSMFTDHYLIRGSSIPIYLQPNTYIQKHGWMSSFMQNVVVAECLAYTFPSLLKQTIYFSGLERLKATQKHALYVANTVLQMHDTQTI